MNIWTITRNVLLNNGFAGVSWVIVFGTFLYLLIRRIRHHQSAWNLVVLEAVLLCLPGVGALLDQVNGRTGLLLQMDEQNTTDTTGMVLMQALWLIPSALLLAYAITELVCHQRTVGRRAAVLLAAFAVILASVAVRPDTSRFWWITDRGKYQSILKKNDTDTIVSDTDLTANLPKGTSDYVEEANDCGIGFDAAQKGAVLALSQDSSLCNDITGYGFDLQGIVRGEKFYAYRNDKPLWRVTQYPGQSGLQSLFYTIEDTAGHLYIVDGGQNEDAPLVRQVIKDHGDHVDGWFLSHPHTDHINALSTILESGDIPKIDAIYASHFDSEKYREQAQDWDVYSDYERWMDDMESTGMIKKLHYVYAGDTMDLHGLAAKCLHDYTTKIDGDAANDGSLVMKFSGTEESMLFCGDTGVSQSDTIMEHFGDDLPSTYIQMGHHGNGGLNEAFYRKVAEGGTRVAFFDAPEWLFHPAAGSSYTSEQNAALMQSLGAKVVYFATAPNAVLIR